MMSVRLLLAGTAALVVVGCASPFIPPIPEQDPAYIPQYYPSQEPPPPEPPDDGFVMAALYNHNGAQWVQATINGIESASLMIDTGATSVVITKEMAFRLMQSGTLDMNDVTGMADVTLADGSHTQEPIVRLRSLSVGGITLDNVEAVVTDGNTPLLGQSFLGRLGAWAIDNGRGVLVMRQS